MGLFKLEDFCSNYKRKGKMPEGPKICVEIPSDLHHTIPSPMHVPESPAKRGNIDKWLTEGLWNQQSESESHSVVSDSL